jgi:hypothetical protein
MHPNRPLILSAYLVALSLLLLPLAQSVLGAWPLRPGEPSWRFGAAGLASNSILTVLMGLLLLVAPALFLKHRWVLRGLAVASALACLMIFLSSGLLALDALELRAQVRPELRTRFTVAGVQLLATLGLGALCTALVGIGAWKAARRYASESARSRKEPERSLVRPGELLPDS